MSFIEESIFINQFNKILDETEHLYNEKEYQENKIKEHVKEIKSFYSISKDRRKSLNNQISYVEESAYNTQKRCPILEISIPQEEEYSKDVINIYPYSQVKTNEYQLVNIFKAKMPGIITYFNYFNEEKMLIIGGDGFLKIFVFNNYSRDLCYGNAICYYNWTVTVPGLKNCVLDVFMRNDMPAFVFFCTEDGFIRVFDKNTKSIKGEFMVENGKPCESIRFLEKEILAYSDGKINILTYSVIDEIFYFKVIKEINVQNDKIESLFVFSMNNKIDFGFYTQEKGSNSYVYVNNTNTFELRNYHINLKNESDNYNINQVNGSLEFSLKNPDSKIQDESKRKFDISNVTYVKCFNQLFGIGCNDMFYLWGVNFLIQ